MLVKICGLSNCIDAEAAVLAGADALGFVMGGKVLPVEVEPRAQLVREIIKTLPKSVDSFLVTHLFDPKDIIDLAEYINSSGIQVSEDIGFDKLEYLRSKTDKKIIKTIVVNSENPKIKLEGYQKNCDYILLDTRFGGYTGGTGVVNDWAVCTELVSISQKPVYLAGGLNVNNLLDALQKTSPAGVDVSTGVSTYSEQYLRKDRKDEKKIKKFISIAKAYGTK
jgi:phosphoribosylanthranilate isomerase